MRDVFRCSNCGKIIPNLNAPCAVCGYQGRSLAQTTGSNRQLLYITDWGVNSDALKSELLKITGFSIGDLREVKIPFLIYDGTDSCKCQELVKLVARYGGVAVFSDAIYAGEKTDPDEIQKRVRQNRISTVFTIVFFIMMMLISLYSQHREEWMHAIKSLVGGLTQDVNSASGFEEVDIIVCKNAISSGKRIEISDLAVTTITRAHAPKSSICPKDVDLILGKKAALQIDRGVVIEQDMVVSGESSNSQKD